MAGSFDVVIIGAGMAGVAAAYELAVRRGKERVLLLEAREPLSLTSDKGTEAYRNWWPSAPMVGLMNRSVDLLEELSDRSRDAFALNRRGYVFLTADEGQPARWAEDAVQIAALGAGELRRHGSLASYEHASAEGWRGAPDGADSITSPASVRSLFPFTRSDAIAALHVRRAGWMNAKALGSWLLVRALEAGVSLARATVTGFGVESGRLTAVKLDSGARVETGAAILAAGPLLPELGRALGREPWLVNELHGKAAFEDERGVVPRDAPLMIWSDPLELEIRGSKRRFSSGVHFRPRGERSLLGIWTYDARVETPQFPPRFDDDYAAVIAAGLSTMVPGLSLDPARAIVDGGYYAKAPDNRPLLGPIAIEGVFLLGGLSGFGVMASQAAAEVTVDALLGASPRPYARAFLPDRLEDPGYLAGLAAAVSGQL